MKRTFVTSLLLLLFIGNIIADEITFVASAPKSVVANKRFKLEYTVNTSKADQPVLPDLNGFDLLTGPGISQSFSSSNINGKMSSSHQITFTYILMPKEPGEYTILGARINVGGEQIVSNSVTVKVLPPDNNQVQNSGGNEISDNDILVRAQVSKTRLYKDETLLLTYKLYTVLDGISIRNYKLPEFNDFYAPKIDAPQGGQFELEHYDGRNYYSCVIAQYLLQPQKSGKLEIKPLEMDLTVSRMVRNYDPFAFMGGYPPVMEVNKSIKSNAVTINVEALPGGAPASFSGAVGDFTISSMLGSDKLVTGGETTYKVVLEGSGNLNLIEKPKVDIPIEFDTYPPVESDEYRLAGDVYKGKKTYEYILTPKSSGSYTIPGVEFTFFNTRTKKYETVSSGDIPVTVERNIQSQTGGNGSNSVQPVNKVRGETLAQDIRYIKSDNDETADKEGYFFFSFNYLLCYICPVMLFVLLMVMYKRNDRSRADMILIRTKKANKVAVKRLKIARKLMLESRSGEFYDEVLKTLWGYFSDKLNIPVAELTKDNVEIALYARGVSMQQAADLKMLLEECEFAHYAPGDAGMAMDRIYNMSINVITDMENSIK